MHVQIYLLTYPLRAPKDAGGGVYRHIDLQICNNISSVGNKYSHEMHVQS